MLIPVRYRDTHDFGMMQCPVWAIQELRDEWWITLSLWFTAEEAEEEMRVNPHRYGPGYRVYGLPAGGELKDVLALHTAAVKP